MTHFWNVTLSNEAKKRYRKLGHSGQKKSNLLDIIDSLVLDLKMHGPELAGWPNYGTIKESKTKFYHCHLKKGRPTYVACWEVTDQKEKKIEVFYVGTHEGAPY